ncbi:hypothetical protein COCNU_scaffold000335G000010 [Cocos nucifera]|nr:hypothetical protein [Cocos nucifera]
MAPAITTAAFEVAASAKVLPTTEVGIVDANSMPSMPPGPSSGDQALKLPVEEETREGKKKKKTIMKTLHKDHFSEPNDDSDERGEDLFDDPKIVQALTNKFATSEVADCMADLEPRQLIWGHQMLAHIRRAHHLEVEAEKGVLRKEEFVSTKLKAALTLEEERKKEAKIKVAELKAQMANSISEAMIWAMKEFKASSKMRNLNVKFGQQAFIKGFELCKDRVA